MITAEQISILDRMKMNEYIPSQILDYTKLAFERYNKQASYNENRYVEVLTESPDAVIRDMAKIIKLVSQATELTPEEFVPESDFNINDLDRNRIETWLAELRIINYLTIEKFSKIRHLKAHKTKRADYCAERMGLTYAIEVTSLSYYSTRGNWTPEHIAESIIRKLSEEEKFKQLSNTAKEEKCTQMLLCVIINTVDRIALNSAVDYLEAAKIVWRTFGMLNNFHISIVTGKEAHVYTHSKDRYKVEVSSDDVVYPPWDE